jgi:hypothetical protein
MNSTFAKRPLEYINVLEWVCECHIHGCLRLIYTYGCYKLQIH